MWWLLVVVTQGCVSPCIDDNDDDGSDRENPGCIADPADWDCDDNEPTVHPYANEICDGMDNDCDSETDEDCDGGDTADTAE